MTDRICILLCVDENYRRQAGVAVSSLARATPGGLDVHIAAFDRDRAASAAIFDPLVARHPDMSLTFHDLDASVFDGLHVTKAFPRSIYTRLIFDRFLDPAIERVLYIDADVVVCGDLRPLWSTDLGGAVLAASRDPFRQDPEQIGFAEDEPYFNSGMLLIDRARWRQEGAEYAILDLLAARGRELPWMDQDALNMVLRGKVRFVGMEWNYQPRCADVPPDFLQLTEADYRELRRRPRLVHYTTSHKPWNEAFRVHYSDLFFAAQDAAGLPDPLRSRRPQNAAERALAVKTALRWRFPGAFRALRRVLKPQAAARMYRAGPQG
ncbi:glycosyltransferase family 8 protein [Alsobacter sp. KACC 23698]|uniref:Glycosyltransferase family 8 protein n=1 Tax=Alsobacter sp. KACC 23698 TaxID=3149229 RepID=A0AAU7JIS0_9HYPH